MIDGAASHGLLEDVAHSRGADADDHLDELRTSLELKKERRLGPGDRPGKDGLSRCRKRPSVAPGAVPPSRWYFKWGSSGSRRARSRKSRQLSGSHTRKREALRGRVTLSSSA
jgi:hypothetical protein